MALCSNAQKPLNGRFYITGASEVPTTPGSNYFIEGRFTDLSYVYTADDVQVGDIIADNLGLTYKIDKIISVKGDLISVDVTYLRGASMSFLTYPASYAVGTLFRPSSKGYALGLFDQENNNENLKVALINSAVLDIDKDIRGFKSGVTSELPKEPKYGDIFYNTTEKKLYAYTENGWVPLGSGVIATGTTAQLPNPAKAGEMFLNKDDNNTYIYNGTNWFKISTNGSTPNGNSNPDPSTVKVREGDLFHNTSDHKLYVYNGTAWIAVDNTLKSGQIYVGNTSNIATSVALSGDATITNSGKLTITKNAITDEKLDKANIPLNGFGVPTDHVLMGDGANNFKISNLANPSSGSDAATKDYVDVLFTNPNLLALPNNNLFVGNSSGKAVAVAKNAIPISGFDRAFAEVSMGNGVAGSNFKIINMADPASAQDAATKNYVDTRKISPANLSLPAGNLFVGNVQGFATPIAKTAVSISEFGAIQADLSMAGFRLTNLSAPNADQDAATKKYVDSKIIGSGSINLTKDNLFVGDVNGKAADVLKNTIPLSGFGAAADDVSIGGFKLTKLKTPDADDDASTKKYVDDLFKTPASLLALPTGQFFIGDANGKAAATRKNLIPVSGFAKANDVLYMGDATKQYNINFLADPLYDQDAATKKYVDAKVASAGSSVLPTDNILVGDASNKAVPVAKSAVPLSDFGAATKDLSLGNGTSNFKISNLADPQLDNDAVNKKYVDALSTKTPTGPVAPGNAKAGDTYYNTTDKRLYFYNGTDWLPLDNKLEKGELFVGNDKAVAVSTPKNTIPLSGFGPAETDIAVGAGTKNFKITNLADPQADNDAATKKYVDSKTTKTPTGPTAPGGTPVAGDTYYNTSDNRLYVYNGSSWVPLDNKLADGNLYIGNPAGIAVATPKNNVPLSGFGSAQGDVSMGTDFRITNLKDPAADQDAATKKYVDASVLAAGNAGKDNLGNHRATENLKLSVFSVSNDGLDGRGLSFDTPGNASFGQDVTVNGNFYTPSDNRLKSHIETLSSVLQKIDQLRGVRFQYKDQHKYAAGPKIGVIAQELQKIYPEMVTKGKDGFLKVDYTQLTGMLIQAVKEQQKEIEQLKTRMDRQQEQINSILKKMK